MHTPSRIAAVVVAASLGLLRGGAAQIPVRPLGPIISRSSVPLGSVVGIHALSDGRIVVNDPVKRRLVVLDARLSLLSTIADTGAPTTRLYPGTGPGAGNPRLFAYRGDSTLFWDPLAVGFLLIDPPGTIARVVSSPSAALVAAIGVVGPMADARGALVYRVSPPRPPAPANQPAKPSRGRKDPAAEDSNFLIRAEVMSHRVDTIARLALQYGDLLATAYDTTQEPIKMTRMITFWPPNAGDDWAVTSDGSIAIIRGRDYHIDWINPDGSRSSTPKIEHQWIRLTDALMQRVVDSLRHTADSINAAQPAHPAIAIHYDVAAPDDIPDYAAPFRVGQTRADADGNLWICITPNGSGIRQITYEIVNRKGVLVDRVQLPGGVTLEGFGPGVAYLSSREGTGVVLAAARIR